MNTDLTLPALIGRLAAEGRTASDGDTEASGADVAAALANFTDLDAALADHWSASERLLIDQALYSLDHGL